MNRREVQSQIDVEICSVANDMQDKKEGGGGEVKS